MSQTTSASLGDLRAIAHALCEDDKIKKQMIDDLRLLRKATTGKDPGDVTDHVALIEQATAWQLSRIHLTYSKSEDIKTRVENYFQVLRYTKPGEVTPKTADSSGPIKTATPEELRNVMLALCENDKAKKRVVNHLRVLRRSKTGGAPATGADPVVLNSATEMELRAIGIAMSDADKKIKKRLFESLHVLSIFRELQDTQAKKSLLKCRTCKAYFNEKDNNAQSCNYHPG